MMASSGRVLIVDDDESIQRLIGRLLNNAGYDVATALDGVTALKLVESFRPQLIFLDVMMPLMDGRSFLDQYFKTPEPRAPVIALTAVSNLEGVIAMGVDDFISKPFSLERILTYTRRYLDQKTDQSPR